jgi:hypothetical protein
LQHGFPDSCGRREKSDGAAKFIKPAALGQPIHGDARGWALFGTLPGTAAQWVRRLATCRRHQKYKDVFTFGVRISAMAQSHLRVYYGPQTDVLKSTSKPAADSVTVPLGEILPLLADAVRSDRTWLRDFEDDEITISTDLYEVILAYQHFRRPSA